LEQSSGVDDPDQFYLMWCGPDEEEVQAMQAAVDQGLVALDKNGFFPLWPEGGAFCCRWQGSESMPAPRWTTIEKMTDDELTYMLDSVKALQARR